MKFSEIFTEYLQELQDWENRVFKTENEEGQVLVDKKEFVKMMNRHVDLALVVDNLDDLIDTKVKEMLNSS